MLLRTNILINKKMYGIPKFNGKRYSIICIFRTILRMDSNRMNIFIISKALFFNIFIKFIIIVIISIIFNFKIKN
jgi:hypothetical protein